MYQQVNLTGFFSECFFLKIRGSADYGFRRYIKLFDDHVEIIKHKIFKLKPHYGFPAFKIFKMDTLVKVFLDFVLYRFNIRTGVVDDRICRLEFKRFEQGAAGIYKSAGVSEKDVYNENKWKTASARDSVHTGPSCADSRD